MLRRSIRSSNGLIWVGGRRDHPAWTGLTICCRILELAWINGMAIRAITSTTTPRVKADHQELGGLAPDELHGGEDREAGDQGQAEPAVVLPALRQPPTERTRDMIKRISPRSRTSRP